MSYNTTWAEGKHALITGASDGIGQELAKNLAGRCRKLTLIARGEERLKKLQKELQKSKTEVEICPMDVRDQEKMTNLVEKIYETDGDQVDIFINCAGGSHFIGPFEKMSFLDIEQIFDTNAKAPIFWLRELLPRMKNNEMENGDLKRGHIIMMSSRSGERALPNLSTYAAAKGTIEKFIEAMRREYAHFKLAFTLVAPGSIKTSFAAKWAQKDRDSHNNESMSVEEAVLPILLAIDVKYTINKLSYESAEQWLNELGVEKKASTLKNTKSAWS